MFAANPVHAGEPWGMYRTSLSHRPTLYRYAGHHDRILYVQEKDPQTNLIETLRVDCDGMKIIVLGEKKEWKKIEGIWINQLGKTSSIFIPRKFKFWCFPGGEPRDMTWPDCNCPCK